MERSKHSYRPSRWTGLACLGIGCVLIVNFRPPSKAPCRSPSAAPVVLVLARDAAFHCPIPSRPLSTLQSSPPLETAATLCPHRRVVVAPFASLPSPSFPLPLHPNIPPRSLPCSCCLFV